MKRRVSGSGQASDASGAEVQGGPCATQAPPSGSCARVSPASLSFAPLAGGRVTPDVVRSLFVAQEVPELATREVLIIHHTDCGAQAGAALLARARSARSAWKRSCGGSAQNSAKHLAVAAARGAHGQHPTHKLWRGRQVAAGKHALLAHKCQAVHVAYPPLRCPTRARVLRRRLSGTSSCCWTAPSSCWASSGPPLASHRCGSAARVGFCV